MSQSPNLTQAVFAEVLGVNCAANLAVYPNQVVIRTLAGDGKLPPCNNRPVRRPTGTRADTGQGSGWARRLRAEKDRGEPAQVALELVLHQASVVLGHGRSESVKFDSSFTELGFNSLGITELINGLAEESGLELTPDAAYECPTPRTLAQRLSELIGAEGGKQSRPGRETTFAELLTQARRRESGAEYLGLLAAAGLFREQFTDTLDLQEAPRPIQLSHGEEDLMLICLCSIVPMSGPHEYAELAKYFQGKREVIAVPQSGFIAGERVPASASAWIDAQVQAILRVSRDRPFILLGHSSGGLIAHRAALRLEELGRQPSALVLLDTYGPSPESGEQGLEILSNVLFAAVDSGFSINDDRLTATGAYLRLLADWESRKAQTRTLLARARDPIPGINGRGWPHTDWEIYDTAITLAGNHLTIMNEQAEATAAAIDDWAV